MSHEINADYNQTFLLPPSFEDWVPANHPARFIRDFMEELNLSELGFKESTGIAGRPHFSIDLKLKIWLYGYFHKIRSLRGLESACHNDLGLMWLTGRNTPDHNTLWMFWRDNKSAIKKLFKLVTRRARDLGLIGLIVHALDGTKIKADVCDSKGWHSDKLLKRLNKGVEDVVAMIESSAGEESGYSLPEDYDSSKVKEALEELKKIERDHLHPVDKDARMMKHGKSNSFCFNAQSVVDDKNGLIVAEDVTSDESDNKMLVPMIEEVEENLGAKAKETVADGGYYSPEQLEKAEEKGLDVLVNISRQIKPKTGEKKFHKSEFSYDSARDVFICPLGNELLFERVKVSRRKKHRLRVYRCHHKDCPERRNCSKDKRGKSIEMGPHHKALQRQIEKQKEPGNKEILARRKGIVEPVFGIIKSVMGFRRFTVRGLENVKAQWSLLCTTYNLRKLFKLWTEEKFVFEG